MSRFLIGFTAGVLAGILFAPEKGTDTRQKLVDRANELKDQFNDFVDNFSNKAFVSRKANESSH